MGRVKALHGWLGCERSVHCTVMRVSECWGSDQAWQYLGDGRRRSVEVWECLGVGGVSMYRNVWMFGECTFFTCMGVSRC